MDWTWTLEHPALLVRSLFGFIYDEYFFVPAELARAFWADSNLCTARETVAQHEARKLLAVHIAAELIFKRFGLLGAAPHVVDNVARLLQLGLTLDDELKRVGLTPYERTALQLLAHMMSDLASSEIVAVKLFAIVSQVQTHPVPSGSFSFSERREHPSFE